MALDDVVTVKAEETAVHVILDDVKVELPVREAVELSFRIMDAANQVDQPTTEAAVKEELATAQKTADAAVVLEVCEAGHPIEGDCVECDVAICSADVCETHCEHV